MKHIVKYILFLLLFCFALEAQGQNAFARYMRYTNSLYLEVGGSGLGGSMNFESIFYQSEIVRIGGRIGVWGYPGSLLDDKDMYGGIIGFSEIFGYRDHYFEIGFNVAGGERIPEVLVVDGEKFVVLSGNIGYRFQKHEMGWMYRITATPILHPKLVPYLGLSMGRNF